MSNFLVSLQITALGMGLVFGAILLLWVMMIVLTLFTADKEPKSSSDPNPAPLFETDHRRQAAALAVAMALAEQELASARPLPETSTVIVSAWQLCRRTSQMTEKGNFKKHSPRK